MIKLCAYFKSYADGYLLEGITSEFCTQYKVTGFNKLGGSLFLICIFLVMFSRAFYSGLLDYIDSKNNPPVIALIYPTAQ